MNKERAPARAGAHLAARVLAAGWLLLAGLSAAQTPPVKPTPAWVVDVPVDPERTLPADARGLEHLLIDAQVRVGAEGGMTTFLRRTMRLHAPEGGSGPMLQTGMAWCPTFESAQVHQLRVLRDGKWMSWLDRTVFAPAKDGTIARRLQEICHSNGNGQLVLRLRDLRDGDIVDFSYSTTGWSAAFGDSHFGAFNRQFSHPVGRLYSRLLTPMGRMFHEQSPAERPAPVRAAEGDQQSLTWDEHDVAAARRGDREPAWAWTMAVARWSDFQDWQDVARRLEPLYRLPDAPHPSLRELIGRIAAQLPTPAQRLRATLNLVQRDIRNESFHPTLSAASPLSPERVLDQRSGDSAGKAQLLVALLRGVGIEAQVALVDTLRRERLADTLPSPDPFDGAVVRAVVDGKTYWLDPSRPVQESDLDALVPADFGQTLVMSPSTTGLTAMTVGEQANDRRRITMDFQLRPDLTASLHVTTRYEGRAAEMARLNGWATTTPRTPRPARAWPRPARYEAVAPPYWHDNLADNIVTCDEVYEIADTWQRDANGELSFTRLPTPELAEALMPPKLADREQALALPRRQQLFVTTVVRLPSNWDPRPERPPHTYAVQTASFLYQFEQEADGHKLVYTQSYVSKSDSVPVNALEEHERSLGDAAKSANLELGWWPVPRSVLKRQAFILEIAFWSLTLAAIGWAAWSWRRRRQRRAATVL